MPKKGDTCRTCNGSGTIDHWVENPKTKRMENKPRSCHACGGSGTR